MQFGYNGFKIQQKDHALFQPHHARYRAAAHILQKLPRRFHVRPAQPIDAVDPRHQKARTHAVKFGDDNLGVFVFNGPAAQKLGHIDQRHHTAIAVQKRAQKCFMAHFRHGSHWLATANFNHLGHVKAIVGFVTVLVDEKFHNFQLIGAGFQQDVGLRHGNALRWAEAR